MPAQAGIHLCLCCKAKKAGFRPVPKLQHWFPNRTPLK
jgi:hypothetical protein